MEHYIGFTIMLFLLSMICERIADYLKHFIGEQNTLVAVWLKRFFRMGDTLDKGLPNSIQEDKRYFRILKINIICGFITAIALHADLFTILAHLDTPENAITWQDYSIKWWYIFPVKIVNGTAEQPFLLFLLGCLFTGLFISFGSKFWHDMLDLLLEVKNIRRKINDKRTFDLPDTIENFDEFIRTPESKLAFTANEKHHDELMRIPGVVSVGPGYMDVAGDVIGCLEVHFNDEKAMLQVPATVAITVGTMSVPIPVNKILTGDATIHTDIFGAGILTTNQNKANGWGSLGCIVKKKDNAGDRYILSCYHVLSSKENLSGEEINRNIIIKQENKEQIREDLVATFTEGMRTEKLDAAIAKITDGAERFSNALLANPRVIAKVTAADAKRKMPVRLFSRVRDTEFSGVVINDSWKQPLKYPDRLFEIEDLLVVATKVGNNNRAMSVKGDSGALILNNNNEAIGIVVGGDDCFTYAIKMTGIEKQFDIELI